MIWHHHHHDIILYCVFERFDSIRFDSIRFDSFILQLAAGYRHHLFSTQRVFVFMFIFVTFLVPSFRSIAKESPMPRSH